MVDAIDLSQVEILNGPQDVASWNPTVAITRLTMKPGEDKGQSFEASIPLSWDFHVPGWGDPAAGDDGNVLYTVWAIINFNGRQYASGYVQMWKGRQWTGAPILTSYQNWWGDVRGNWSVIKDYVPSVGDTIGFFATAGNARLVAGPTSVRERTNVIAIQIPPNNDGEWNFTTPVPPPKPDDNLRQLAQLLAELRKRVDQLEVGALKSGDRVSLRTDNRHVICAEGGGGGAVHSDRTDVGSWETFTLEKR